MKYTQNISICVHEVKQSKFMAWLTPYDKYKSMLNSLKEEHPKARHFVTAFRYLNEYEQIVEGSSDDGEPKGTSGKPSLIVLQGQELINCAVIIVRYFGGTKLGTGGLVRAYSEAVNLVIHEAKFKEYKKQVYKSIELNYSDIRFIDYECGEFNITIVEKIFDTKIIYNIKSDEDNMNSFLDKVKMIVKEG